MVGPSYQLPSLDCSMSLPAQIATAAGSARATPAIGSTTELNQAWPCADICAAVYDQYFVTDKLYSRRGEIDMGFGRVYSNKNLWP